MNVQFIKNIEPAAFVPGRVGPFILCMDDHAVDVGDPAERSGDMK
jgi:hypothetical protein